MSKVDYKHKELTEKVIKAFYAVYNTLGYGFLEKVYENALMIELESVFKCRFSRATKQIAEPDAAIRPLLQPVDA